MNLVQKCEECNGSIVETVSDLVCVECGLVVSPKFVDDQYQIHEVLDGSVSRFMSPGQRKHIVDDLGSFVGYYGQWKHLADYRGRSIPHDQLKDFLRMKRVHDIYAATANRSREYNGLRLVNQLSAQLELNPNIRDKAASFFTQVHQLKEKTTLEELAAGSIYLAIRITGTTVPLSAINLACEGAGMRVKSKRLIYAAGVIRSKVGGNIRAPRAENYVEKVLQKTLQDNAVRKQIAKIGINYESLLRDLRKTALDITSQLGAGHSRNPFILACASIVGADSHLALHGKYGSKRRRGILTQRLVAKLNEIKEYTLREHYLEVVKPIVIAWHQ